MAFFYRAHHTIETGPNVRCTQLVGIFTADFSSTVPDLEAVVRRKLRSIGRDDDDQAE
jgi:hypothetical protein